MLAEESLNSIYLEAIKQGGLVLTVLILSTIMYVLYKMYVKEKTDHSNSKDKYTETVIKQGHDGISHLMSVHKDHENREDKKLSEMQEDYEKVIVEKNQRINKLEDQLETAERRHSEEITKFLIETISTRNTFTKALDDHKREMHELIKNALNE